MSESAKLIWFYVEVGHFCGIRASKDIETVKEEVLRDFKYIDDVYNLRVATKSDIAWVQSMGGRVPS